MFIQWSEYTKNKIIIFTLLEDVNNLDFFCDIHGNLIFGQRKCESFRNKANFWKRTLKWTVLDTPYDVSPLRKVKCQLIWAKFHPVTDALQPAGPFLGGWGLKWVSLMTVLPGAWAEPLHTPCSSSYGLSPLLHCVCLVWGWVFVSVSCLGPLFPSENEILPWIPADLGLAGQALLLRDWIVAHLLSHSLLQTTTLCLEKGSCWSMMCLVHCYLPHA